MYHTISVLKSEGLTFLSSGDIGPASWSYFAMSQDFQAVSQASHSVDMRCLHCFHFT